MWMQMVLFTLLFPVLPYVLWKCYNKEKKPERGEAVLRYVIITSRNLQPLFHGAFRTYFSKITHFFLKNT